jgi:hypothetical protein
MSVIPGGSNRKIMIQGQPGRKLVRPYLKNKLGTIAHPCGPSYLEDGGRRILDEAGPGKSSRPHLKNKLSKKD